MKVFSSKQVPILYSFRRCPYAMRARMALMKSGIKVEIREILLRDKPKSMLQASSKGTVPTLILEDDTVIDESLDVMKWALLENDPDGWLKVDDQQSDHLIQNNDGVFKKALDQYKYPNRYPDEDCSDARSICQSTLEDLNQRLEKTKYLFSDNISMPDIAIFPFIRQCAFVDKAWFDGLPYQHLHTWLSEHLESALFSSVMIKYEVWSEGDEPVYFGS